MWLLWNEPPCRKATYKAGGHKEHVFYSNYSGKIFLQNSSEDIVKIFL